MAKKENIARYTSEELTAMIARGEDRSDMAKANREMTEEEIVAQILAEGVEDLDEWNSGQIWKGLPR
jgi:hypothetical protein